MENLIADFVQLFRSKSKTFLNIPHFQRCGKLFTILFSNSHIHFMAIISQFRFTCAERKLCLKIKVFSEGLQLYFSSSLFFQTCVSIFRQEQQIGNTLIVHFTVFSEYNYTRHGKLEAWLFCYILVAFTKYLLYSKIHLQFISVK